MPEPQISSRGQLLRKSPIQWFLSAGVLLLLFPLLLGPTGFSPQPSGSGKTPKPESGASGVIPPRQGSAIRPPVPPTSPAQEPIARTKIDVSQSPETRQPPAIPPLPPQPPPEPAESLPPIPLRVAIANGAASLAIAASTPAVILDAQGQWLGELAASTPVLALAETQGIQVGSKLSSGGVVWLRPTQADGRVYVEGRWYRGALQLVLQEQRLLAVNHVDLESYLYSVVGAEMPASWSLEALKAQAIAARSYALVHISRPASQFYDLGATPRWQAYLGLESETNTTHAAVNRTRGMLVSYQGGVVESLYAASDQLVAEAHGGFGMSQEGAQKLAQQRYNFQQILGYFYPGTQLARLEISQ